MTSFSNLWGKDQAWMTDHSLAGKVSSDTGCPCPEAKASPCQQIPEEPQSTGTGMRWAGLPALSHSSPAPGRHASVPPTQMVPILRREVCVSLLSNVESLDRLSVQLWKVGLQCSIQPGML